MGFTEFKTWRDTIKTIHNGLVVKIADLLSSEDSEGEGMSSSDGEDFDADAGDADDSEDYSDCNDQRRKKARAEWVFVPIE